MQCYKAAAGRYDDAEASSDESDSDSEASSDDSSGIVTGMSVSCGIGSYLCGATSDWIVTNTLMSAHYCAAVGMVQYESCSSSCVGTGALLMLHETRYDLSG